MDEEDGDQNIQDLRTIPNQFKCPISLSVMRDPAITVDGFTFQRRSIQQWFKTHRINPLTRTVLNSTHLIENRALRQVIQHHNQRVRNIETQATISAQNLMANAYKSIQQLFPEIMGDSGVSLDKVYDIFMNISKLQTATKKLVEKYSELKCTINNQGANDLQKQVKEVESVLAQTPNYSLNLANLQLDQISYIIISTQTIRMIDFKRFKKQNFVFNILKGLKLKGLTLGQIKQKIKKRNEKEIPKENQIRFWKTSASLEQLFEHINNDVETVTGSYVSRVKGVGKRLANMKDRISELKLEKGDYFIIQHFEGEQYVFRDQIIKCDYCYKSKQSYKQCQCGKAFYCSSECYNKDNEYHHRVCINNQNKN